MIGLALSLVTGLLLFTADIDAYFGSWIFWTKLVLIGGLLANGWIMRTTEFRIGSTPNAADPDGWSMLKRTATASIVLWFAIAFAGVALVNLG